MSPAARTDGPPRPTAGAASEPAAGPGERKGSTPNEASAASVASAAGRGAATKAVGTKPCVPRNASASASVSHATAQTAARCGSRSCQSKARSSTG